ncbi:MAG: DegT/DnrJ/EryC1/StrS family aminotransferase [Desertimonas sp.]
MIPITRVELAADTEARVLAVLRSGQLAQGEVVEEFERRFATLHQVGHAVAVNNGTTALVAAMQAIGLRPGDEVITTPFTFIATLNAILEAGATARFADIGDDYNVLPEAMEHLVNERTRALLPVHLYGYPVDMDGVRAVAARHGLPIVEDAAQAVAASFDGRPVGGAGVGCFSLYATKNLSTGEGGVVTTDDDAIADRLRLLRNQGMRERYVYEIAGHNYRLTNVAAAIGVAQLGELSDKTARRQANAARLTAGLRGVPGLLVPPDPDERRTHVYHQYTVRVTTDAAIERDEVIERLTAAGIGCGIYYPRLVNDYECYADDARVSVDDTPHARRIATEVLSLPVHPSLTDAELDTIVDAVRQALGS